MLKVFLVISILMFQSGCATAPKDPEALKEFEALNDPLEPMNRKVFEFNMAVDEYVLDPVTKGYRMIFPKVIRTGIKNVVNNLGEPATFVNNLLQFEFQKSAVTLGRFVTNTFLGIGGLFDVATNVGVPSYNTNFSETLAVWGFSEGPYLVLPIVGPANVRSTVGFSVGYATDPLYLAMKHNDKAEWLYIRDGLDLLTVKDETLDLYNSMKKDSIDFYATMRSTFQQNQKKLLQKDDDKPAPPSYEFDIDEEN